MELYQEYILIFTKNSWTLQILATVGQIIKSPLLGSVSGCRFGAKSIKVFIAVMQCLRNRFKINYSTHVHCNERNMSATEAVRLINVFSLASVKNNGGPRSHSGIQYRGLATRATLINRISSLVVLVLSRRDIQNITAGLYAEEK